MMSLFPPHNSCTLFSGKDRSNTPPPELKIVLLAQGLDDGDAVDLCLILYGGIVVVEEIAEFETRVFLMFETAFAEPLTHLALRRLFCTCGSFGWSCVALAFAFRRSRIGDAEAAVEDLLGRAVERIDGVDHGVVAETGRKEAVPVPCFCSAISDLLGKKSIFPIDEIMHCVFKRAKIYLIGVVS